MRIRSAAHILLACGLFAADLPAQQFNIDTIAGGYIPDGIPAASAPIDYPIAVATDAAGNYYFAVPSVNRVFKVDSAGQIHEFAGTGVDASSGDGGLATAASLSYPTSLAVDAANLYIGENGGHKVRRVSLATGTITTLAGNGRCTFAGDGGQAASASLCYPGGLALDGAGNLYIAEINNHRVRKVVLNTGIISTVAGNGTCNLSGPNGDGGPASQASFCSPGRMAADGTKSLYIPEGSTGRVRKVDLAAGTISTVAGNGTCNAITNGTAAVGAAICYPAGVALDRNGNLYIADPQGSRIVQVSASGSASQIAGDPGGSYGYWGDGGPATSAGLNSPIDVAVDGNGNLFIADFDNKNIRKIDSSAARIISTVAGSGGAFRGDNGPATDAALWSPWGVSVDGSDLYIVDRFNSRVRHVDLHSGIITTVAGSGVSIFGFPVAAATATGLQSPASVLADGAGSLYIAEGPRIRRVDLASGIMRTLAGTGFFSFGGDGGDATSASLNTPIGMAVDSRALYFADSGNHRIRKIDLTSGIITTIAGTGATTFNGDDGAATSINLNLPEGVALDASGNLYVADSSNNRVRRIDLNTGLISTIAGPGTPGVAGDGGPATSARVLSPRGLALDGAGNLYIAEWANCRIRKVVLQTGIISTIAGNVPGFGGDGGPATFARMNGPNGLTVDANGVVYVSDTGNNRVRRLAPPPAPLALTLSRAILNFQTPSTPDQTIAIGTNGAPAGFTAAASGGSWLSVSPASGTTPATVTISVNPAGLSPGNYSGDITITAATATNSPQRITVNLTVGAAQSTVSFERHDVPFADLTSFAVADFNLDGKPDVVASNQSTTSLLLGNGDGTFQPPLMTGMGTVVLAGDFNGDGMPDLVLTDGNAIFLQLGNGDGTFQDAVRSDTGPLAQVVAADFNGDGKLDLAGLNAAGVTVLFGNGDGSFQPGVNYPAGSTPVNLAVSDLDTNGYPDLAVGTSGGGVVLLNQGDGTFGTPLAVSTGASASLFAAGDFDLTGKPDLLLSRNRTVSVMRGNGDGTFLPGVFTMQNLAPDSVAAGDFDGDGNPDLALSTGDTAAGVTLLPGQGDGSIRTPINVPAGTTPIKVTASDLNSDGKPDLVVRNANGLSVLINATK